MSRNDPQKQGYGNSRVFCRPLLRFLSFSQWCLLPHRLTVVTTKDVSCIFCCFQYGLAFRGFACHDFHHHCITIVAFFKINIIGTMFPKMLYKMGTHFRLSANPTSFRFSKKQPLFSRSHLKLLPGVSRGKKWMPSFFALQVTYMFHHPKVNTIPRGDRLARNCWLRSDSYRNMCALFFFLFRSASGAAELVSCECNAA